MWLLSHWKPQLFEDWLSHRLAPDRDFFGTKFLSPVLPLMGSAIAFACMVAPTKFDKSES